jgi:hypothetical protein
MYLSSIFPIIALIVFFIDSIYNDLISAFQQKVNKRVKITYVDFPQNIINEELKAKKTKYNKFSFNQWRKIINMFFVVSDRNVLIEYLAKGGIGAELGVFKGENAEFILKTVNPKELHLVDQWRWSFDENNPFADIPKHLSEVEKINKDYIGENINGTLQNYSILVREKFKDNSNVFIYRKKTSEVVKNFNDNYFDFIYIDANHNYEFVMRDLLEWSPKLKKGGIIILNDFDESSEGQKQNLGTIGAVTSFMKRTGKDSFFQYIALTSEPFSDVAISNDLNSAYCRQFTSNLLDSDRYIIEMDAINVAHYNHKFYYTEQGRLRILPSFK